MTSTDSEMPPPIPQNHNVVSELDGSAVSRFILRFTVIAIVLALVPFIPGWDAFVARYMSALAVLVNALLHLVGQPTQVEGANVFSLAYNVTLAPHCSALDIVLFFSSTVLAFPTSVLRKIIGLVLGVIAITALNLVRISTVYLVGVHSPAHVQSWHEKLWPVLLVMGTVVLCAMWLSWANARRVS